MIKFGVNTWVWVAPLTTEKLESIAPKVSAAGFDIVELPLEDPDLLDTGRIASLLREHGLAATTCVAMGPDRDLIHSDPAVRENGMAYVRRCIDTTQAVGAPNLVGPIYSAVGRTWQSTPAERARDTEILVQNLRALAAYAGDHNVVLGIEPLNRFETSFINTAAQAIAVVDQVDHPACKIMLDTFHMNIEEKSLGAAIHATGRRLCHLHACENDRGAPGSGNVAWNEVAAALADINFAGPVVIESFTAEVKTIAKAAAIWRPLAASQDQLAEDGLAFLSGLLA
jgi:D-psicose/D-tagatose/L-ribulose 3-epimerase